MARTSATLAILLLLFGPSIKVLGADLEVQVPDGGVALLGDSALFKGVMSNSEGLALETKYVDIEGRPFKKALQVRTEKPTAEWWAIQFVMGTIAPVKKGDAVLATFYMRCIDTRDETGEAYLRVLFETGEPRYNKSIVAQFGANQRWRKVSCPFTVVEGTDAGGSLFAFAFPNGPQTIEIAGLSVINYGTSISYENLPLSTITYAGRELDAPWRKDARQRIEKLRKGDLRVTVKTADGRPAPGARVLANMTRHAFPFGTAVSVPAVNGRQFTGAYGKVYWFTEQDEQQYSYWLRRWFTKATPETALMPGGWSGVWPNLGREVAINGVKKYHALGYDIRGHMLVWPGWQWFRLPGIKEIKEDPEKLGTIVIDHVIDETSTLKPWINEWTLLNEPFAHHDLMDVLGEDAMVDWFKAGHQANPEARLYINDYGILSGGGLNQGHQDHYEKTIKFLLDKGAPLHGIGMQGHFGDDPTAPEKVYEILNRFAAFGKEMQITEFDINTRDLKLQADYTRDFMTICFSHPSIVGFSFWGFWENDHWRSDAALIDKDWKLKPNGEAYEQLVLQDWWTRQEGVTDKDGSFALRGFLGDYRVAVFVGETGSEHEIKLKPEGATLEVVVEREGAVKVAN